MALSQGKRALHNSSKHSGAKRIFVGSGIFVGVALIGATVATVLEWPKAGFIESKTSLAHIELAGVSQKILNTIASVDGRPILFKLVNGDLVPQQKLAEGVKVHISFTVERPSWISWLTGRTERLSETVITPKATLLNTIAFDSPTKPLLAYFSSPVQMAAIDGPAGTKIIDLTSRSKQLSLVDSIGSTLAGTITVAASPETWESLPTPSQITYFRNSSSVPMAVVSQPLDSLSPSSPITITLSKPVSQVFGAKMPSISPQINGALLPQGKWVSNTPYSITYTPTQADFWPSEQFTMTLPTKVAIAQGDGSVSSPTNTLSLQGAPPSITRLQQLLAQLNYLPLSFTSNSALPTNSVNELASTVLTTPVGSFNWKWSMPSNFTSLWQSGTYNVITRGAVMSFEQFNHLDTNGLNNPLLWPTLLQDVVANKTDPHRYSWIEVEKQRPEMLYLYENGSMVFSTLVNTGIQGLNTTDGTYPIYLRFVQDYMSGTNPNGTTYHDLVHWINYFLGSEAVHGFVRSQYGFPQSLGCVELPVSNAAIVYPQVHIGTLVTIVPQ
ncbi:L,D-transpeptidase catalytic domain [Ferrithrix thermotolerans DSM 19514]|uniref:L,D-transpeptidase catalytic domain n=1 Tax=Ferrithrix thermotolerans DSM 19514 TaxID=1121881 RepID=A0A1M4T1M3_9ACTN|nr:L,D-transpeptidase catalytic domain [Ferrithrix thermotolerans DSM 19514]